MRKLIGILSLALSAGCGTVGAPQPPSLHLPEPVRDLRASRKGDKVTLTWTQPTETTDHEAVGRWVGTTNICRTIVPNSNMPAMSSCGERVGQTAPQPAAKTALAAGQTDELSLERENSQPTAFAGYAVEVTNRRGRSAGLSNAVSVPLAPTRQPPGNLTAEVRADGVYFTATPVAGPVNDALRFSYRLYRRTEPAAAGENPALVAEQPTGRILGIHLIAPEAEDLINEAMYILRGRMTIDDLIDSLTVFPIGSCTKAFTSMSRVPRGSSVQ